MVRKIKAKLVLQLCAEGFSGRQIAASQGMSRHSVVAVVEAADREGLGWDDVAGLDEAQVYARLFPGRACMTVFTPSLTGLRCTASWPGSG